MAFGASSSGSGPADLEQRTRCSDGGHGQWRQKEQQTPPGTLQGDCLGAADTSRDSVGRLFGSFRQLPGPCREQQTPPGPCRETVWEQQTPPGTLQGAADTSPDPAGRLFGSSRQLPGPCDLQGDCLGAADTSRDPAGRLFGSSRHLPTVGLSSSRREGARQQHCGNSAQSHAALLMLRRRNTA